MPRIAALLGLVVSAVAYHADRPSALAHRQLAVGRREAIAGARLDSPPHAPQDTVRSCGEVVFGNVPIPQGSHLVRASNWPGMPSREYATTLSREQIQRFFRRELTKRGYTEQRFARETVFHNGRQYITVSWRDVGRFLITRDDWRNVERPGG